MVAHQICNAPRPIHYLPVADCADVYGVPAPAQARELTSPGVCPFPGSIHSGDVHRSLGCGVSQSHIDHTLPPFRLRDCRPDYSSEHVSVRVCDGLHWTKKTGSVDGTGRSTTYGAPYGTPYGAPYGTEVSKINFDT